jgi:hypothetical protein
VLWNVDAKLHVMAPLVAIDGVVYDSKSEGGISAYDGDTGEKLWGMPNVMGDYSAPTIEDGRIFVSGSCENVRAHSLGTGAQIWAHQATCTGGSDGTTAPAAGGVLYHGDHYVRELLDVATGELLDIMRTKRLPAIARGIRLGVNGDYVHAEQIDGGRMLWETRVGETATPPLIVDDEVWIVLMSGEVRVLDFRTGAPVWNADIEAPIASQYGRQPVTGLAAGDGVVAVAGDSRLTVYSGGAPDPDPVDPDPVDPDPVDPDPVDPDPVDPDPVDPDPVDPDPVDPDPIDPDPVDPDPVDPDPSEPSPPVELDAPPADPWPPLGSDLAGSNPDTSIVTGPAAKTARRSARFALTSDQDATFECRLDRGDWRACDSTVVLRRLGPGRHRLRARAVASATGLADPTPAAWGWKVRARG